MPTLTIQLPGLPPVEHILRDELVTVGRMKGNTIALDDASVSISHAKITRRGTEFFLKDLNSTNGTMLNGQSINETRLKDGDQLKFGEVIAMYHAEPEFVTAGAAQHPSPPAVASATLASKSLITQASQMSQRPPAPAHSSQVSHVRTHKKQIDWVLPVVGSAVVLIVAIAGVKFFGNDAKPSSSPSNVAVPATNSQPKNLPGNAAAKPGAVSSSKTSSTAPAENKNVTDLKKSLKAIDPVERRRGAAALHALGAGAKDAVPELRNALNDSDQDVRMWSALALINNKSYDKATIPILIKVLHHDNSMLRQVACLSLALIPYEVVERETAVAALMDAANKDSDEEVRKAALSALKIIAPESAMSGK